MNPRPAHVSVIDPISPAIDRVRTILFRPFDLGKWFVIGFSAWLAQLGSNGGGGNSSGGGGDPGGAGPEVRDMVYEAKEYILNNLDWIIPVAVLVFVLLIGLWLAIVYVSSRGRFSFLYCVAQNKGEFWIPWRQYEGHGNSLFGFRIVLGLLGFVTVVLFLVLAGVLVYLSAETLGFTALTILGIIMSGLLFVASLIIFGVISVFTTDFVVPIMYKHNVKCRPAWRALVEMIAGNMGRFVVYVLFQLVIGLAIGAIVLGTVCVTCGCACCLYMVPYISTVVLLPLFVFKRSYSLYYLAQYGPDFNVIEPEPEEIPPVGELQL